MQSGIFLCIFPACGGHICCGSRGGRRRLCLQFRSYSPGILEFENSTFRVLFSLIRVLLHLFLHVPDSAGQDACEDQKSDPEKDIGCVAGTGG